MSRRLLAACVLVVAASAAAAWLASRVRVVDDVVDDGPAPAALVNPYLAAAQFLSRLGVTAEYRVQLSAAVTLPPPDHALLLIVPPLGPTDATAAALLDWVAAGGHLIVDLGRMLPGAPGRDWLEDAGFGIDWRDARRQASASWFGDTVDAAAGLLPGADCEPGTVDIWWPAAATPLVAGSPEAASRARLAAVDAAAAARASLLRQVGALAPPPGAAAGAGDGVTETGPAVAPVTEQTAPDSGPGALPFDLPRTAGDGVAGPAPDAVAAAAPATEDVLPPPARLQAVSGVRIQDWEGEELAMAGGADGAQLLRLAYGDGTITALASSRPFANGAIRCHDHAWLLARLVEQRAGLWIVQHVAAPHWLDVLWRDGYALVKTAAIAILLLLWAGARRLGPVIERAEPQRRSLAEHLRARGEWQWRRRAPALLAPLRASVRARVARRHAMATAEDLAARLGLPPEAVSQALEAAPRQERDLVTIVRTLQRMGREL
jgi:hypothetical protein